MRPSRHALLWAQHLALADEHCVVTIVKRSPYHDGDEELREPRTLRHSMALLYLAGNQNDLVGLSMLLGNESLNATRRYHRKTAEGVEKMAW